MTKLIFFKKDNKFVGFECKGHSGYAENGSDIICASVSVATQMCVAYLDKYHHNKIELAIDEKSSSITIRCNGLFDEADKQISILNDFAISLHKQYPKYFTYSFLEV